MTTNKIEVVKLKGGLIGLLADNPKKSLENKIQVANKDGWHVVQIIPDDTGNLFVWVWRIFLLCITIGLFTSANGYYVILKKDEQSIG